MKPKNIFSPLQSEMPLTKHLSFRLVRNVILVAVPLGFIFIAGQILLDFSGHKENLNNTATQVFHIVENAANHILWTMDKNGGRNLAAGVLRHDAIIRVEILNNKGEIFSWAEKDSIRPASLASKLLFSGYREYSLPLENKINDNVSVPIGELKLTIDPRTAAEKFVKRSTSIIVFGVLITVLLAGVLLCVFHFSLVNSLLLASSSLSRILPQRIGSKRIHLPQRHQEDELGRFIQNTNELLSAVEENISSREQAENEVRRLNRDLEARVLERTKELEAFTYSVTHDLRTSVRSIEGFSKVVFEEYGVCLDTTGKTYLGFLQDAGRQMNDHIDALLTLSKTTTGGIIREKINLSDIAVQMVDVIAPSLSGNKPVLNIEPDVNAFADRRLATVVLKNLLENAIKYSGKKSRPVVTFGTASHQGGKVFFVRDNGTGFDMSQAGKLFLPFRRIHRHDEFSGTGIGLATVERIILRHNGKIWSESEVGKGAVFYFTLG